MDIGSIKARFYSNQMAILSLYMLEGEAKIIQRIKEGDRDGFGELYDHYQPQIYRFVFFKVGNKQEAEDLTHQVFMNAFQRMDSYEYGQSPFSSWLYRIARNQVIDFYRLRKPNLSLESADPELFVGLASISEDIDGSLATDKVKEALSVLRPEYQDVIIMRFVEELSLKETAEALDKSVGAVKLLQYRALDALKKNLNIA